MQTSPSTMSACSSQRCLAFQQETSALALHVFGGNGIVAGAAFGQQVDLAVG
jgi:hypothetical protein